MPRLSLYRPEKGNDFRLLDRVINEQFQVGGTDIVVHKYLGPQDPDATDASPSTPVNGNPIAELGIQDVLFMENRDRKYDRDVYVTRGIYTMQDIDFNLSQFGFFLTNDNIMITFHLRATVDLLGRKLMSGDVLELPHLKDEYALGDDMVALKRFYVITDVTRAATGYSQTWYPHLLRVKCEPLVDSQEFKQILDGDAGDGVNSLRDVMSMYNKNIEINNQIIAQAEEDANVSGYDTTQFYVLPTKEDGLLSILDASIADRDASEDDHVADASSVFLACSFFTKIGPWSRHHTSSVAMSVNSMTERSAFAALSSRSASARSLPAALIFTGWKRLIAAANSANFAGMSP